MKKNIITSIDFIIFPILFIFSFLVTKILKFGLRKMPISRWAFNYFGILPIRDHYYEPLVNPKKHLKKSLRIKRQLIGIDFNIELQKSIINQFHYNEELLEFPIIPTFKNGSFEAGDAEYLYNIIRFFKPKKIIEIGSGSSTRMIINGISGNKVKNVDYDCNLKCIEPYEYHWIENLPVEIIKKKVEDIKIEFFQTLNKNDILFIDSSHVIRPQGDVLQEIQQILPNLNPGVIIHFHDIFSPRDYPDEWIFLDHRLWNEQYILEAYLTFNNEFEIIGSLNYLKHEYWDLISSKCPILKANDNSEPGSFWFRKVIK